MIIIEGIRRSGKTYAINVLKKNFPHLILYKDLGIRITLNSGVDPDDYAVGRDLAYAQGIPTFVDWDVFPRIVFDRQYWSSYVYGQAWRKKYDKTFWKAHVVTVEDIWGVVLKNVHVVLLTCDEDALLRIENMDRTKDEWEITRDFRKQYELYQELPSITKIPPENIHRLPAFMKDDYIADFFKQILLSP
jgi:hypothetical protein